MTAFIPPFCAIQIAFSAKCHPAFSAIQTAASTKCHPEPEHLQAARNVLKHECDGEGSAPLVQSESLQAALLTSSLDGIVFKALIRGLDCCANEHKCQGTT